MADDIYGLTAADVEKLRRLMQRMETMTRNPVLRTTPIEPDIQTPQVYVALTPPEGIDGLTTEQNFGTGTGSGTGTGFPGAGNTPGYADCPVYRVVWNNTTPDLEYVGFEQQRVLNLNTSAIAGEAWVVVAQDKFGDWYAVAPTAGGNTPSEVHVALTPSGGLPGMTLDFQIGGVGSTGTGTFGSGNTPGYAVCDVYKIQLDGVTPDLVSANLTKTVYNLHGDIDGGEWVIIAKDKYGNWYVVERVTKGPDTYIVFTSAIAGVEYTYITGTGTGTGTVTKDRIPDQVSSAVLEAYQIVGSGLVGTGRTITVYNVSNVAVIAGRYAVAQKDHFGKWVITSYWEKLVAPC